MKVLVTGGSGLIGREVCKQLSEAGHAVHVLDRNNNSLPERVTFHKGDATRFEDVFEQIKNVTPDSVCHLVGYVSFAWSLSNPQDDLLLHSLTVLNVLESCRKLRALPHVLLASSSAIYGNADTIPTPEDTPPNCTSPYAASKLAAENYCKLYSAIYRLPTTILRLANVYGERSERGVVRTFVERALRNEPIIVFGGKQKVQFLHVEDAASSFVFAVNSGVTGTFNVGGDETVSLDELLGIIFSVRRQKVNVTYEEPQKGDILHTELSTEKVRKALGWKPRVSLQSGIHRCVHFYSSPSEMA